MKSKISQDSDRSVDSKRMLFVSLWSTLEADSVENKYVAVMKSKSNDKEVTSHNTQIMRRVVNGEFRLTASRE